MGAAGCTVASIQTSVSDGQTHASATDELAEVEDYEARLKRDFEAIARAHLLFHHHAATDEVQLFVPHNREMTPTFHEYSYHFEVESRFGTDVIRSVWYESPDATVSPSGSARGLYYHRLPINGPKINLFWNGLSDDGLKFAELRCYRTLKSRSRGGHSREGQAELVFTIRVPTALIAQVPAEVAAPAR